MQPKFFERSSLPSFPPLPRTLFLGYLDTARSTMRSATSIILFSLGFATATQIPLFERLIGAGHLQVSQSNQTDSLQADSQNFGKACSNAGICGDFFDGKVDHALFCSPAGVCAGRGSICGTDAACSEGTLSFNFLPYHCFHLRSAR